jgi:competence protein ComEA
MGETVATDDRPVARAAALRAQGGLLVLVALGAAALALAPRERAPASVAGCRWPREARAEAGFTRVVTCDARPGGGGAPRGPARWLFGGRVALAEADARLLEALPGIGPARARAILEARARRPFERVSELERVHGIGPATVRGLAPFLRVDPPPLPESTVPGLPKLESASAKTDAEG